jgi:hypothetical protein
MASRYGRERASSKRALHAHGARRALLPGAPLPARRIDQVCVAVDEPGHYQTPGCVDVLRATRRREILDAARGANLLNEAVADQHRSIQNDAQVFERGPPPGHFGAAQREQLPCAPNQYWTSGYPQSTIIGLWSRARNAGIHDA